MPRTILGKWSIVLIIIFILLFALFQILVASGQEVGDTFSSNLVLSIPWLAMVIAGILAFFTGIVSIIVKKERSIFVFLATGAGLFALIFVLGELIFPQWKSKTKDDSRRYQRSSEADLINFYRNLMFVSLMEWLLSWKSLRTLKRVYLNKYARRIEQIHRVFNLF